jgi:hypothetical protein
MSRDSPKKLIERAVRSGFPQCPFCRNTEPMLFQWATTLPKLMICSKCNASWQPLLGFDTGTWRLVGAKLVSSGGHEVANSLFEKTYDAEFWKRLPTREEEQRQREAPALPERVVIMKEIVKIRCRYCGSLYDEVEDRCPYCSGTR